MALEEQKSEAVVLKGGEKSPVTGTFQSGDNRRTIHKGENAPPVPEGQSEWTMVTEDVSNL